MIFEGLRLHDAACRGGTNSSRWAFLRCVGALKGASASQPSTFGLLHLFPGEGSKSFFLNRWHIGHCPAAWSRLHRSAHRTAHSSACSSLAHLGPQVFALLLVGVSAGRGVSRIEDEMALIRFCTPDGIYPLLFWRLARSARN